MGNPIADMTSMHQVLDVVEHLAVEARSNEGGDAVERLYYELYKPDEFETRRLIREADTDSDFDAFAALGAS